MAGPNVLESREHALKMARQMKLVTDSLGVPLVFKASFDKANRTSPGAFRGPGLDDGLRILDEVRHTTGLPIVTDVHEPWQAAPVARVAQVLQIPAFLCRQTDLLQAAGATHRVVHLKKGQWCAPAVATSAAAKLYAAGAAGVVLCERGTQFGYTDLVVDVRNLEEMRLPSPTAISGVANSNGVLISADITHALQRPCGQVDADGRVCSGGARRLVPAVARACAAAGADGLFLEVHDNPRAAPVDAPTQWPLRAMRPLLRELMAISAASSARRRGGREPSLAPAGDDWTPDDEDDASDEW